MGLDLDLDWGLAFEFPGIWASSSIRASSKVLGSGFDDGVDGAGEAGVDDAGETGVDDAGETGVDIAEKASTDGDAEEDRVTNGAVAGASRRGARDATADLRSSSEREIKVQR